MAEQQQQQQQQQRSGSGTNGTGGRPPNKPPSTTGNKEGGGKKARDRKKANERRKTKNQQKKVPKDNFLGGVTDTDHLLYKYVISPHNGNMAQQCRLLLEQIKLYSSTKGMYKLTTNIMTGITLVKKDFLSPMPDVSRYSTEAQDTSGNKTLIITKPALKMELDTVWQKTLNNDIAKWTKYEAFSKGLFSTTLSQLHDKVISACALDKARWTTIVNEFDLIGLIKMVETDSTQNKAGKKVFRPFGNLTTIEKCVAYKQCDTVSNTEFVKEVNTMYRSVIFQNG
jgi:hypothetical protein